VTEITKNNVTVLKYDTTSDSVDCFVTTKQGGYSEGCFSSMNMAVYTDDDPKKVIKNTEKLKSTYGLDKIATLLQVHGNIVHEVTSENYSDVLFSEGDGLFTTEKDLALGILTADCYNLFLASEKAVAALHCGHKSISADIMSEGIKIFERHDDFPTFAGIGPGISVQNYEVSKEMADSFEQVCPSSVQYIDGTPHICLRTVIEENLKRHGIKHIEHLNECSYDNSQLYSYRRDNGQTGRMLGVIVRRSGV
jgi:YfiH family protein